MLFPESLPAVADAVMLEALLQGPSQYFFLAILRKKIKEQGLQQPHSTNKPST